MKRKVIGNLPSPRWLRNNGYGGLVHAIQSNPEAFAHIGQEHERRQTAEWIPVAEALAKGRGGKLPNSKWLVENGYSGLAQAIQHNPDTFKHIPQDRKVRPIESHVIVAMQLAKEHGKLPNYKWLVKNGFGSLTQAMRRNPDAFADISQDRKRRGLDEHVAAAKQLAKKYGKLPSTSWLQKNGYKGLDHAIRRNPRAFGNIPQDWKGGCTLQEHVVTAQQLAKKHGKLPNRKWLRKTGYHGLLYAMRGHPEVFAHIPKESKRRTPDEWVREAERLAKEHGGILPCAAWLRINGYTGLEWVIRKHAHLFASVPKRLR